MYQFKRSKDYKGQVWRPIFCRIYIYIYIEVWFSENLFKIEVTHVFVIFIRIIIILTLILGFHFILIFCVSFGISKGCICIWFCLVGFSNSFQKLTKLFSETSYTRAQNLSSPPSFVFCFQTNNHIHSSRILMDLQHHLLES